jgi:glutamate dehydrogenase
VATSLPDDAWFLQTLRTYFPAELAARYGDRLQEHPLRREIVTKMLVNELVNRGGITFAFRAAEETGADAEQVARAYAVCREIFGLRDFVHEVELLDNRVETDVQTGLYLTFRRLLDRSVRWFLQTRPGRLDIGEEIARFSPVVAELEPRLPELLVGEEHKTLQEDAQRLVRRGVPEPLALRGAGLLIIFQALDITEIAHTTGVEPVEVARVYLTLSDRYNVDGLLSRISNLPRIDRWQALARAAMRYDLYAALEALTVAVLTTTPAGEPGERIEAWERSNAAAVGRAAATLEEIGRLERGDLASLSVALRTLRGVVRTTA